MTRIAPAHPLAFMLAVAASSIGVSGCGNPTAEESPAGRSEDRATPVVSFEAAETVVVSWDYLLAEPWFLQSDSGSPMFAWLRQARSEIDPQIADTSEVFLRVPLGGATGRGLEVRVSLADGAADCPRLWRGLQANFLTYMDSAGVWFQPIDGVSMLPFQTCVPVSFESENRVAQLLVGEDLCTLAFDRKGLLHLSILRISGNAEIQPVELIVSGRFARNSEMHDACLLPDGTFAAVHSTRGAKFGEEEISVCRIAPGEGDSRKAASLLRWDEVVDELEAGRLEAVQLESQGDCLHLLVLKRDAAGSQYLRVLSHSLSTKSVANRLIAHGSGDSIAFPSMDADSAGQLHVTWMQKTSEAAWQLLYQHLGFKEAIGWPKVLSAEPFRPRPGRARRPTLCRGLEFATVWAGSAGGAEKIWFCRGRTASGYPPNPLSGGR
ncbi:MAG: hypothetical protein HYY18_07210 [Planctomycetes bacterium]|nr:hypothetical protein [Planctomycetota bacterium]